MSQRITGIIICVLATVLLCCVFAVACVGTRNIPVIYRDIEVVVDSQEIDSEEVDGKPVGWDEPSNTDYIDVEPQDEIDTGEHGIRIALVTMDVIDPHWLTLHEGAQKAAEELGVTVKLMPKQCKCDHSYYENIDDAIADGFDAIVIAAIGPDAVTSKLLYAQSMGIKIVYVDSPANVPAEATFLTDNTAAGKTAGEQMLAALESAGITSGKIGIVNVNAATVSVVQREAGFREAFVSSGFEIMETQYGEGDSAKSQTIAENYVTQGVVGIFGANEGSTVGAGNAIKSSGNNAIVGVGFDKSDTIMNLIADGWLLCALAQNPDVMGYEGVKAAVAAINGQSLGGEVFDVGVTVLMG